MSKVYTRRQTRNRLNEVFRRNKTQFNCFCDDEFPAVHTEFMPGQTWTERLNVLLEREDPERINAAIDNFLDETTASNASAPPPHLAQALDQGDATLPPRTWCLCCALALVGVLALWMYATNSASDSRVPIVRVVERSEPGPRLPDVIEPPAPPVPQPTITAPRPGLVVAPKAYQKGPQGPLPPAPTTRPPSRSGSSVRSTGSPVGPRPPSTK